MLFVAMVLAALAGNVVRQRRQRRDPCAEARSERDGYIVTSTLTLLGLLIGFTFALAVDRYEARRLLVVDDANAIETLYLRAQLLDEPHRTRFSNLLVRYVDNHIRLGHNGAGGDAGQRLLADNQRLQAELWTATLPAFDSIRGIDFSTAFVDSVNRVIELDATRTSVRVAQIPAVIFDLLFVYAVVTAFMLGNDLVGRGGQLSGFFLLGLFTLALMLLTDINRPVTGAIRESQQPMERLQDMLRHSPPGRFDRLKSPTPSARPTNAG